MVRGVSGLVFRSSWNAGFLPVPVSKAGAFTEQKRFVYCLRFLGQSEEGMVLDAVLPEGLAHVSTGHGEL